MNETTQSTTAQTAQDFYLAADALCKQEKWQEAINHYSRAVSLDPSMWQAYFDMGTVMNVLNNKASALVCLHRAADCAPDNARVWTRLGTVLRSVGRHEESLAAQEKALALEPDHPSVNYNLGMLYQEMNQPARAVEYFDKALACTREDPVFPQVYAESRWMRAQALLRMGDYEQGWPAYEARLDLDRIPQPQFPGERWTGQALKGKRIFLTYELRFGDVIQCVRFAPQLKKKGATVLVQCPKELARLVKVADGVDEVVEQDAHLPDYDYHLPITSVPVVLKTPFDKIPAKTPYFDIPGYLEKLPMPEVAETSVKVGLIWAGIPLPVNRSAPVVIFAELMNRREAAFYSFQMDPRREDIFRNRLGWVLQDLGRDIDDFYTSGRLMRQMDLIISIDSAPAHLAGALGIPVWLLLTHHPDWRWMVDRSDNPWYPSMRLFRQSHPFSWMEPSQELKAAFNEWLDGKLAERKKRKKGG